MPRNSDYNHNGCFRYRLRVDGSSIDCGCALRVRVQAKPIVANSQHERTTACASVKKLDKDQ